MVGERNVGEEAAGLVLEGAQRQQVIDAVLHRLHVPVEHRAVGGDAQPVGLAVHREPFLAGELLVGDRRPRGRAEHLGPSPRQARHPRFLHPLEHLAHAQVLDARQVRDLDGGERLDLHVGVTLLEAAEHLQVIGEPQLGVQPADDVELARRVIVRGVRFGEHLLEAAGVGALFPRHPRERAEHARVAQDADVGRVDVLVRGEVDAVAVAAPVGQVAEAADGEEIAGVEEGEPIVAGEPLTALDLGNDRGQRRIPGGHQPLDLALPFRNPQSAIRNFMRPPAATRASRCARRSRTSWTAPPRSGGARRDWVRSSGHTPDRA